MRKGYRFRHIAKVEITNCEPVKSLWELIRATIIGLEVTFTSVMDAP